MALNLLQLHGRELELQRCRSRLEVVESDLHAAEQEKESLQRKVELLETALESPGSRLALRRILERYIVCLLESYTHTFTCMQMM